MCKACTYWKKEWAKVQDVRDGAIEPDDFYKEVNYRPREKKAKRYPQPCPRGNGEGHVYLWTSEFENETGVLTPSGKYFSSFYERYGVHLYESLICVGCGQRKKHRRTKEAQKIISKIGWYKAIYGD